MGNCKPLNFTILRMVLSKGVQKKKMTRRGTGTIPYLGYYIIFFLITFALMTVIPWSKGYVCVEVHVVA